MVLWWRKGAFYDLNEFSLKRGTKLKVFHKIEQKRIFVNESISMKFSKQMSCFEDFIDKKGRKGAMKKG